ncbi:MAG: T9SS C-terminal target domain-containing protein [Ignavibacteriales bacterium]|nr:MAG: T9SS C-terminal target domain-containing protein [Ignavibacteriales bacterium]
MEAGELIFYITDNSSNSNITITLELVPNTLCWDAHSYPNYDLHNLTTSYNGSSQTSNFKVLWSSVWVNPSGQHVYALGQYKVIAKIGSTLKKFFYLDYRTSTLPENFQADLILDYSVDDNKFYRRSTKNEVPLDAKIWSLQPGTGYSSEEFEPLQPDNFDLSIYNNHPKLTWGHSASPYDFVTGYAIYRGTSSFGPFSKVATISAGATNWIDWEFASGNMLTLYYKMVAVNGVRESQFTQTASIKVVPAKEGNQEKTDYNFTLLQNYPNPFNPTTTISYSIPSDEHVTLKVFNTLGEEVAELVNEIEPAGIYRTNFNAENLPSGIYIYRISAGKYTESRKLILIK